ncbi:MAG: hypothetical protein R3E02_06270 [Blastomonas sp.]
MHAISRKQGEDALDRVFDPVPGRREQILLDPVAIEFQNADQDILLSGKEMVEAAGMNLAAAEDAGAD